MKNKRKRSKMSNQMMVVLSTFDLFGSVAYSLTSLPMPEEDGVYGSKGTDATCTAQGFFIQVNCMPFAASSNRLYILTQKYVSLACFALLASFSLVQVSELSTCGASAS